MTDQETLYRDGERQLDLFKELCDDKDSEIRELEDKVGALKIEVEFLEDKILDLENKE